MARGVLANWDASIAERPHLWQFAIPAAVLDLSALDMHGLDDWKELARSGLSLRNHHTGHAAFFEQVQTAIQAGPGFALLQRIPVEKVTYRTARLLHVLLGKSFGELLPQDPEGSYLCDVIDADETREEDRGHVHAPGRRWNDLPCHTDHAFGIDPPKTVAFLCFRSAGRGGAVRLVSTVTLVERLGASDPTQIETLSRPVPFDPTRQLDPRDAYLAHAPILAEAHDGTRFRYLNYQIDLNALDVQQTRAIGTLESIISSGEVTCRLFLRPGDVLFVNNMRVLHGRDAYENATQLRAPRHHLRLWLT